MTDKLDNREGPGVKISAIALCKIATRTGNLCTLCVEYTCDTYDARCGLNLQTDSGYIADYKVVENLRQAGPNVISEVTHEFIGYFFPFARFLTSRAFSPAPSPPPLPPVSLSPL